MRLKLPTSFTDSVEWLGDFIGKIRQCEDQGCSPLHDAKNILDELIYINDFAKNYHHSTPGADMADIDDGELRAYATRAIKLCSEFLIHPTSHLKAAFARNAPASHTGGTGPASE